MRLLAPRIALARGNGAAHLLSSAFTINLVLLIPAAVAGAFVQPNLSLPHFLHGVTLVRGHASSRASPLRRSSSQSLQAQHTSRQPDDQWEALKLHKGMWDGTLTRSNGMAGKPIEPVIHTRLQVSEVDATGDMTVQLVRDGIAGQLYTMKRPAQGQALAGMAFVPLGEGELAGTFCTSVAVLGAIEQGFKLPDHRVRVVHKIETVAPQSVTLFVETRPEVSFPFVADNIRPDAGWLEGTWRCVRGVRMMPDGEWMREAGVQDQVVALGEPTVSTVALMPAEGGSPVEGIAVRRSVNMRVGGFGGEGAWIETAVLVPGGWRLSVVREIDGSGEWVASTARTWERVT